MTNLLILCCLHHIYNPDHCKEFDLLQEKVASGLDQADKGIYMINELSLFSSNEEIDEVATNELK